MLEERLAASLEPSTRGVSVVGARAPACAHRTSQKKRAKSPDLYHALAHAGVRRRGGIPVPRPGPGTWKKQKKMKKKQKNCFFSGRIRKTRAESHAIDATRHLYTLQYPVWNLSRLQMIHGSSNLALLCAPRECVWSWPEGYRNFNR